MKFTKRVMAESIDPKSAELRLIFNDKTTITASAHPKWLNGEGSTMICDVTVETDRVDILGIMMVDKNGVNIGLLSDTH